MIFKLNGVKLWSGVCIIFYLFRITQEASVGVLLGDNLDQEQQLLNSSISKKYANGEIIFSANVQRVSEIDSLEASETLCRMLNSPSGVIAIFGPRFTPATAILESICLEFEVPYISTSWRPIPRKDKGFFMNFFPDTNYYSNAVTEIIASFGWKSFVVVYESDDTLLKLEGVLQFQRYNEHDKKNKITFEKLGRSPDHSELFKKIARTTQTNIILDCRTRMILPLLRIAKEENLLNVYNNYFLLNLDALTLDYTELNTTANITTIRLFDDNDNNFKGSVRRLGLAELIHQRQLKVKSELSLLTDTALYYDAIYYLHDVIKDLPRMFPLPLLCNGTQKFGRGMEISLNMKGQQSASGLTGPIQFDNEGSRIKFNIYVVDILHNKKIATWFEGNTSLYVNAVIGESVDVVTNLQTTKIIVSSRLGAPYLMLAEPEEGEVLTGNARYQGYSLDLIAQIAKIVGFEFEIILTEGNMYGYYDDNQDKWTGLIGDVIEKRAHLAICDLTITPEREEAVDFSLPFMSLGIGILYRAPDFGEKETFAFLNPFSQSLWMTIFYSYIVMTLCLYVVLRLSPDDWERKHPCDELDETLVNHWNLKNTLLLSLRALTMQGSDAVPKGKSARLAISMWWLFCLIITSSYIANLALTVNQSNQEPTIANVQDLASQNKVKYGMLQGGATESFFRSSNDTIYQRIWHSVENNLAVFTRSNQEGVERVLESENGLYAFFMESTSLEYELARHCELRQVGDLLDTKYYGIAMPQNAPYRTAINRALLKLQEDNILADLKRKWWIESIQNEDEEWEPCEDDNGSSAALSVEHIRGLYIILGLGILAAFTTAILELLWYTKKVAKAENLTFCEALYDELKMACYIWTNRRKIDN